MCVPLKITFFQMEIVQHHTSCSKKSCYQFWISFNAEDLHRMGRHLGQTHEGRYVQRAA